MNNAEILEYTLLQETEYAYIFLLKIKEKRLLIRDEIFTKECFFKKEMGLTAREVSTGECVGVSLMSILTIISTGKKHWKKNQ